MHDYRILANSLIKGSRFRFGPMSCNLHKLQQQIVGGICVMFGCEEESMRYFIRAMIQSGLDKFNCL